MTARRSLADQLLEVSRELASEPDKRVVFDRVLQTWRELTGARYAAVGILNERGDGLETFLTSGVDRHTHTAIGEPPRGRDVLGALITDPRPLRLDDVATYAARHGFPAGHPEMHSFLGVPIMIARCVRGNLYLTGKADGAFTEQDELATVILAGWAAIAIENARLQEISEQRRQRVERATRALEIVRDATVATGAEPDLTRVLVLIASGTREVVSAASAAIWLRDGGELVVHAAAGPDSASASGGRIYLDSEFVRALKLGRTLRVASTSAGGDVIPA